MEHVWIAISVFAALMQAVRTAAQKTLNQRMSNLATTYVRSLVGLPIMLVYLGAVLATAGGGVPRLGATYLALTFLGALTQVLATMLLIYMFQLRSFAVGTMLTKCDIVITAILGSLLFSENLSALGFAALIIVLIGVVLLSVGKIGTAALVTGRDMLAALWAWPTLVALTCALLFTFSYLFLREATLAIEPGSAPWRGAWTVVIATAMQVVFGGVWLLWKEPAALQQMWPNRGIAGFIGLTSALGSIGWFTAFAMQNASYVRAAGQIEVVFTVLISALYFHEKITALEYAGMIVTVAGVLTFRLAQ